MAVEVLYLLKTHMGHIAVDRTQATAEVDIFADDLICYFEHQNLLLSLYIFNLCFACQVLMVVVMRACTHQVMVVTTYLVEVM